jgi:hypothetical protein
VWKLKALYYSDENRARLQFDPGGTNDAQLLERLINVCLAATYVSVSQFNELIWKRAVILISPPLNIYKSYLVYNFSTPTCILGTQWPDLTE